MGAIARAQEFILSKRIAALYHHAAGFIKERAPDRHWTDRSVVPKIRGTVATRIPDPLCRPWNRQMNFIRNEVQDIASWPSITWLRGPHAQGGRSSNCWTKNCQRPKAVKVRAHDLSPAIFSKNG